jgi:hypothetical protein
MNELEEQLLEEAEEVLAGEEPTEDDLADIFLPKTACKSTGVPCRCEALNLERFTGTVPVNLANIRENEQDPTGSDRLLPLEEINCGREYKFRITTICPCSSNHVYDVTKYPSDASGPGAVKFELTDELDNTRGGTGVSKILPNYRQN